MSLITPDLWHWTIFFFWVQWVVTLSHYCELMDCRSRLYNPYNCLNSLKWSRMIMWENTNSILNKYFMNVYLSRYPISNFKKEVLKNQNLTSSDIEQVGHGVCPWSYIIHELSSNFQFLIFVRGTLIKRPWKLLRVFLIFLKL